MYFIGAHISIVLQSTYYLANGRYPRIKKIIFILYGFLLFALVAIGESTNEIQGFLMWITNRDIPGGPEAYLNSHLSAWFNVWGTSAILTANLMGDGLLLYRCYILLANSKFLIILPALLFVASTTLGIFTSIESALPNASIFSGRAQSLGVPYVAITTAYNVLVTSLICGRIFFMHLSIRRLGVSFGAEQWGIIAILIESALPFSIVGVIFTVLYATSNPLADAFGDVWGSVLGLSPQLIILRVAMGHAWTSKSVSVQFIDHMQFEKRDSTTDDWSGNSENFCSDPS